MLQGMQARHKLRHRQDPPGLGTLTSAIRLSNETVRQLSDSLNTTAYTYSSGSTHSFYNYPARFHPSVARTVISEFSRKGSWVLDPFMGGGTSVVEGLALGRKVIGTDINSLARFVCDVRTRPLSQADELEIRRWAQDCASQLACPTLSERVDVPGVKNLPPATELFMAGALNLADGMLPRRRDFARATLLRLGQWALDCRDFRAPTRRRLANRLPGTVDEMLLGLREFVSQCGDSGIAKSDITGRRVLLNRSAVGVHNDHQLKRLRVRPRLLFTSPPYPGVHVLYHRWQYQGRRGDPCPVLDRECSGRVRRLVLLRWKPISHRCRQLLQHDH